MMRTEQSLVEPGAKPARISRVVEQLWRIGYGGGSCADRSFNEEGLMAVSCRRPDSAVQYPNTHLRPAW